MLLLSQYPQIYFCMYKQSEDGWLIDLISLDQSARSSEPDACDRATVHYYPNLRNIWVHGCASSPTECFSTLEPCNLSIYICVLCCLEKSKDLRYSKSVKCRATELNRKMGFVIIMIVCVPHVSYYTMGKRAAVHSVRKGLN